LFSDWGEDELKRSNHERVSRINKILQQKGLRTWFDEERMNGNIRDKMAEGIESTKIVIAFITEKYRNKVNSNNAIDNCYFEFNYATLEKSGNFMIPVVMEPKMRNSRNWKGRLGAELGTHLYVDLSDDTPEIFTKKCEELYQLIIAAIVEFDKSQPQKSSKTNQSTPSPSLDIFSDQNNNSKNNNNNSSIIINNTGNKNTTIPQQSPVVSPRLTAVSQNFLKSLSPPPSIGSSTATAVQPVNNTSGNSNNNQFKPSILSTQAKSVLVSGPSTTTTAASAPPPQFSMASNFLKSLQETASPTPHYPTTTTTSNNNNINQLAPKFSFADSLTQSLNSSSSNNHNTTTSHQPSQNNNNNKKICAWCQSKNDSSARKCHTCQNTLVVAQMPSDLIQESLQLQSSAAHHNNNNNSSSSSQSVATSFQIKLNQHPVVPSVPSVQRSPRLSFQTGSMIIQSNSGSGAAGGGGGKEKDCPWCRAKNSSFVRKCGKCQNPI
jgi:ribosomal protein L40E